MKMPAFEGKYCHSSASGHPRIYYELSGTGPAVIFLHSFLCDGGLFKNQIEVLDGIRAINVDLRGHGRSDSFESKFSIDDLVEDVMAVLDREQIEAAIWIGSSIGGFVALEAALRFRSRVAGLVLIGSDFGAPSLLKKIQDVNLKVAIKVFGARLVAPTLLPFFFSQKSLKTKPDLVAAYRKKFGEMRIQSTQAFINAAKNRENLTPRLSDIHCPTLIMVGEGDRPMSIAASHHMATRIPNAEIELIQDAGHLCSVEQPVSVNRALVGFFESIGIRNKPAER